MQMLSEIKMLQSKLININQGTLEQVHFQLNIKISVVIK